MKNQTETGAFGSLGRYQEVPVAQMSPEMKAAYNRTMQLRGLVSAPHKIWLTNPIPSRTIVPIGAYCQKESTLTKAGIEIVTVLTNARWHSAYSTYEHEKIAEKLGQLPAETVERLIAGLYVQFSDGRGRPSESGGDNRATMDGSPIAPQMEAPHSRRTAFCEWRSCCV